MGLSRRRFTREFKLAAMERMEQGVSVGEVARALVTTYQKRICLACQ
jgi:transposase-like protein